MLNFDIQKGNLVFHKSINKIGLVLKRSSTHKDFYVIMSDDKFEEWHVSNIKERSLNNNNSKQIVEFFHRE